jgi:hypothetical protein
VEEKDDGGGTSESEGLVVLTFLVLVGFWFYAFWFPRALKLAFRFVPFQCSAMPSPDAWFELRLCLRLCLRLLLPGRF